jgi:hypothetical protein
MVISPDFLWKYHVVQKTAPPYIPGARVLYSLVHHAGSRAGADMTLTAGYGSGGLFQMASLALQMIGFHQGSDVRVIGLGRVAAGTGNAHTTHGISGIKVRAVKMVANITVILNFGQNIMLVMFKDGRWPLFGLKSRIYHMSHV